MDKSSCTHCIAFVMLEDEAYFYIIETFYYIISGFRRATVVPCKIL